MMYDLIKIFSGLPVAFLCTSNVLNQPHGLGTKLRYVGYFSSLLHPQEEKFGCYPELETCPGGLETYVVLSYLWSVFCK